MPPRSISSAIVLVGLCSLAALETGGCSNSSKSLASVTRTGLPLLSALLHGPLGQLSLTKFSRAVTANNPDQDNSVTSGFLDGELAKLAALEPHCGRYNFGNDGKVIVWDALTSKKPAQLLTVELSSHEPSLRFKTESNGAYSAIRGHLGHEQRIEVRPASKAELPDNCRRPMPRDAQSVAIVSAAL